MFSKSTRTKWRFIWVIQLSDFTYFTREFIFHSEGLCKWGPGKTCWDYCPMVSSHTREAKTLNFRWKQTIYLQKSLSGAAQDKSWAHFAQRHNGQKSDNLLIKSLCDIMYKIVHLSSYHGINLSFCIPRHIGSLLTYLSQPKTTHLFYNWKFNFTWIMHHEEKQ